MRNRRRTSSFKHRSSHHNPVINAMEISREYDIDYWKLKRRMKRDFNLDIKLTRNRALYYDAKDFRSWIECSGLINTNKTID